MATKAPKKAPKKAVKAVKNAETAAETMLAGSGATAPEFDRAETAPDDPQQYAEPTVEPTTLETHVSGAQRDSGKEEINEDVPVQPAPAKNIPAPERAHDRRHNMHDRRPGVHSPRPVQDRGQQDRGNHRNQRHNNGRHNEDACRCNDSPYPPGKMPPPPILLPRELEEAERPKAKTGKDGIDRAMEILDEYYEGTPQRNPKVDHGGED